MKSLSQRLTKTIKIEIIPTNNEDISEERIWAINWFNYKNKWLYTLYNRLASPHVIKVGGQLLFKGHQVEQLNGRKDLARETLLIVTYPKVSNFLEMLTVKAFQIKSLLRVKSVKDFVFGFTKRIDEDKATLPKDYNGNMSYLVFHYTGSFESASIYDLARENGVKVFFHGEKMAQLKRIEDGKEDVIAPFIMDGLIIFETGDDEVIAKFSANESLLKIISLQNDSYLGKFSRIREKNRIFNY